VIQYAQYAVGIALVLYAVFLAVQKFRGLRVFGAGRPAIPTDDVRIVSDLATRLRSQGKSPLALGLHAELLKPEEPRT
jgi:hypothetical protein